MKRLTKALKFYYNFRWSGRAPILSFSAHPCFYCVKSLTKSYNFYFTFCLSDQAPIFRISAHPSFLNEANTSWKGLQKPKSYT